MIPNILFIVEDQRQKLVEVETKVTKKDKDL